jgi:hypothetical protein
MIVPNQLKQPAGAMATDNGLMAGMPAAQAFWLYPGFDLARQRSRHCQPVGEPKKLFVDYR